MDQKTTFKIIVDGPRAERWGFVHELAEFGITGVVSHGYERTSIEGTRGLSGAELERIRSMAAELRVTATFILS